MSVQSLGCNANIQVARCLCTTLGPHWGFHVCSNRNSWRTRAAHYRTCALDPFVRCANLATAGERGVMPSGCLLQNQLLAVTTDPLSHSLLSNFRVALGMRRSMRKLQPPSALHTQAELPRMHPAYILASGAPTVPSAFNVASAV